MNRLEKIEQELTGSNNGMYNSYMSNVYSYEDQPIPRSKDMGPIMGSRGLVPPTSHEHRGGCVPMSNLVQRRHKKNSKRKYRESLHSIAKAKGKPHILSQLLAVSLPSSLTCRLPGGLCAVHSAFFKVIRYSRCFRSRCCSVAWQRYN
ncbi:unnamed protein product [Lactuca virosa]|uniref:Nuclear transcription factor Y subunit n=1 Tax=Lactuca virosa TaxID=75947 RepID=A0AAU9NS23_9ASTR|nr:unnamed protein product [Lactuca virosa]